jgi:hypothetical protein
MAKDWSIESELISLSGTNDLRTGLVRLGLIGKPDQEYVIDIDQGWFRSGAETYSFFFTVKTGGNRRSFVLKACTPAMGGTSLEVIFEKWLARRKLVSAAGVNTPDLYAAGKGVLLEQYIPLSLAEFLREKPGEILRAVDPLCRIAAVLMRLGFRATSLFADLRTDTEKMYLVDFGEDLGEPRQEGLSAKMYAECLWSSLCSLHADGSFSGWTGMDMKTIQQQIESMVVD